MFFWGWSVFSNQQHLNNNKSELASITRYHNKSHSNPTDDDDDQEDNNNPKQNRSSQNVLLPIEPSPHPDEDGEPLMASPSSLATTTNRKPLITISSPLSGTDDEMNQLNSLLLAAHPNFIPKTVLFHLLLLLFCPTCPVNLV